MEGSGRDWDALERRVRPIERPRMRARTRRVRRRKMKKVRRRRPKMRLCGWVVGGISGRSDVESSGHWMALSFVKRPSLERWNVDFGW